MSGNARGDWDFQAPPWLRHAGPMAIALIFLLVTLSGYSVFEGFDEKEPATRLSQALMVFVVLLCLAAARNPKVDPQTRSIAWVLGGVSWIAAVDEAWGFHEEIGYWVQDNLKFLPSKVRHFTDDVIILGGAFAGAYLLYWLVKRTGRIRELTPYIGAVVILAVTHGLLDIVSHGIVTLKAVFPDAPEIELRSMEDQLSTFEEYCKIWSAWFVVLFVQRLFHRDRVALAWSWIVCLTTPLAAFSLWKWTGSGVPYLKLGGALEFIRNFHSLAELCLVWIAWTLAAWMLLRDREEARNWFGLLYPVSAVVLAGGWTDAARMGGWITSIADRLLPNAYWDADFFAYCLLAILFLGPAFAAGWLMARAVRLGWVGVLGFGLAVGVLAVVFGRPSVFVVFGMVTGIAVLHLLHGGLRLPSGLTREATMAGVVLLCGALLFATLGPLIPNYKFKDKKFEFFRVKHQTTETRPSR